MLAVYELRALYTSLRFQRLCPGLFHKFSSGTLKELRNSSSVSWSLLRVSKFKKLLHQNLVVKYSTSPTIGVSGAPSYIRDLNVQLAPLMTTKEHLELFESLGKFASIGDKVCILFRIAKITERDEMQLRVLETERVKSQQGHSSTYVELLNGIVQGLYKCNSWNLANLMWALGKIQETNHEVVQICEEEILSRGIGAFKSAEICQIVNGCTNLNVTTSGVFSMLEEGIFNDEVRIRDFENRELSGVLLSYAKTDYSFTELFHGFLEEILSRDFSGIGIRALAEFVWSFAKKEVIRDQFFLQVEEEILRRGTKDLHNAALTKILWAFGKVGRGSKRFFYFLDGELVSRGAEKFDNALLLQIVWSFTTRNATKANVFGMVERELFNRGLSTLKIHELVLILFSFVSAQRQSDVLVAKIEGELCSRDVKRFSKGDLCQIAWSLGRAGKSDSQLFDAIEAEMLQRGTSELPSSEDHMLMLMRGFIEAKRGTETLFEFLARYFCKTNFRNLKESGLCECAWCFTKVETEVGGVFDSLGKEIFHRGKYCFNDDQMTLLKESFRKVGKGSKQLFDLC